MPPKSRPIALVKLHRIHLAAQATRVEFGHELGGMTWRGEGGNAFVHAKEAAAFRMATCWNVLEGIPTKALIDGVLRDMVAAVVAGDLAKAQTLVVELDAGMDWTNDRLHDCSACLGRDEDDEIEIDFEPEADDETEAA